MIGFGPGIALNVGCRLPDRGRFDDQLSLLVSFDFLPALLAGGTLPGGNLVAAVLPICERAVDIGSLHPQRVAVLFTIGRTGQNEKGGIKFYYYALRNIPCNVIVRL